MYPYQNLYAPQNSIIWISGEQEAVMYPVAPNNAVTLWSQTEPVVYLKQADASGRPSMKIYDLIERAPVQQGAKGGNLSDYATKRDLAAFNEALDAIRTDIDAMRGDLYGIAGKKRKEEEE